MKYKLMPHQRKDSAIMARGDTPNFSFAGTGKTVTCMEAMRKSGVERALIVAPPIALLMWKRELEAYLDLPVQLIKTGKTPLDDSPLKVISYGVASAVSMHSQLMGGFDGDALITDEGHNLKNYSAKRTIAVFGESTTGRNGLFANFDVYWNLTGDPILKYSDDLWSQLRASHADILRAHDVETLEKFRRKFTIQQLKKYHPRAAPVMAVVGSKNDDLLNKIVYGDVGAIRRTLKEVDKNMPPITYRNVYVKIHQNKELAAIVRGKSLEELAEALSIEQSGVSRAVHVLNMMKVEGAVDYLAEMVHNGPILCGVWHRDVGDALYNELKRCGLVCGRVIGGQSIDQRQGVIDAFNRGDLDVLVGQIAALGVSANLQQTSKHVVIVEDQPSHGVITQFIGRVWRLGQKEHVQVDFVKADHIVDEVIERVRKRKEKTTKNVLTK